MMATAQPFTGAGSALKGRPSATPTGWYDTALRRLGILVLESCHSTWIFDPRQLEFCRILKGIEVGGQSVVTEWRPYWQVQLDPEGEGFTVYLNGAGTRLIRSWRHGTNCEQCGASHTAVLFLEDIHRTLHGHHGLRSVK
jgi:hypothetical protein